jgi:GH15 family glucan-1,4-alpha-glucosidase
MAIKAIKTDSMFGHPAGLIEKADWYLNKLESVMTEDGKVPELYTGNRPNWSVPLAWAQSFYVVARQSLLRAHERLQG